MNARVERRENKSTGELPANEIQAGVYPAAYSAVTQMDDGGGIDIAWLWLFVKRRFWLIATIAVVGTAVAAMYGLTRPVLYTATAEVVIDPTDTRAFGLDSETGGLIDSDSASLETELRIARSPDIAHAVISRLGLDRRMQLELAEAESGGTTLSPALQPFAKLLDLVPTNILVATGLASEIVQLQVTDTAAEARRKALNYLANGLGVRQSGRSRVFQVSFTAERPSEAASVANTLADAYVNQQLAHKVGGTPAARPRISRSASRSSRRSFGRLSRRSRTTGPRTS